MIDAQRTQAIGRLDQLRKKTREELRFFIDNGSPKLRSIAVHLHKRLMPEEPLPDSAL